MQGLPKGTILHIVGYMDNTAANFNIPDPRNWQRSGNRSVTNMFIDLGLGVELTDEQFIEAMEERREVTDWKTGDHIIGCPLCAYTDLVGAQRLSYSSGQNISPGYEGWEEDPDGARWFVFGYMNRNWEEEPNIPVGADNSMLPGGPDLGQPTHFLPRRNRFVFRVPVPDDFNDDDELVWTLTAHGVTEQAFATLHGRQRDQASAVVVRLPRRRRGPVRTAAGDGLGGPAHSRRPPL